MSKKFRSDDRPPANLLTDDRPTGLDNFDERAAAYARTHGGKWHVIRSDKASSPGHATPAQWIAWMRWFFRHTIPTRAKESHGVCTVPSEWPEEFDANCEASDRSASFPAKPWMSPQARADLSQRLRTLSADLARTAQPPAPKFGIAKLAETPQEKLSRLASEYASSPVVASSRLLAALGYDAPRDDGRGLDDDMEF